MLGVFSFFPDLFTLARVSLSLQNPEESNRATAQVITSARRNSILLTAEEQSGLILC